MKAACSLSRALVTKPTSQEAGPFAALPVFILKRVGAGRGGGGGRPSPDRTKQYRQLRLRWVCLQLLPNWVHLTHILEPSKGDDSPSCFFMEET